MSKSTSTCRPFLIAWIVATVAAAAGQQVAAQQPGAAIEGVVTLVQLGEVPGIVKIRTKAGDEVQARVGKETQLVFADAARGYVEEPKLSDLRPGMTVVFTFDPGVMRTIRVTVVPLGLVAQRAKEVSGTPAETPRTGETRLVKARLVAVDLKKDDIRVDVNGREESFHVADHRRITGLHKDDLVILTVGSDGVVNSIHLAALAGRVTKVDETHRQVVMDVGGRPQTFGVESRELLAKLEVGRTVRFEVEQREGGTKVLTAVF